MRKFNLGEFPSCYVIKGLIQLSLLQDCHRNTWKYFVLLRETSPALERQFIATDLVPNTFPFGLVMLLYPQEVLCTSSFAFLNMLCCKILQPNLHLIIKNRPAELCHRFGWNFNGIHKKGLDIWRYNLEGHTTIATLFLEIPSGRNCLTKLFFEIKLKKPGRMEERPFPNMP